MPNRTPPAAGRPLYVIRLRDDGYYAASSPWQPVAREGADRLVRKDARCICAKLRNPRIGYHAEVELYDTERTIGDGE